MWIETVDNKWLATYNNNQKSKIYIVPVVMRNTEKYTTLKKKKKPLTLSF